MIKDTYRRFFLILTLLFLAGFSFSADIGHVIPMAQFQNTHYPLPTYGGTIDMMQPWITNAAVPGWGSSIYVFGASASPGYSGLSLMYSFPSNRWAIMNGSATYCPANFTGSGPVAGGPATLCGDPTGSYGDATHQNSVLLGQKWIWDLTGSAEFIWCYYAPGAYDGAWYICTRDVINAIYPGAAWSPAFGPCPLVEGGDVSVNYFVSGSPGGPGAWTLTQSNLQNVSSNPLGQPALTPPPTNSTGFVNFDQSQLLKGLGEIRDDVAWSGSNESSLLNAILAGLNAGRSNSTSSYNSNNISISNWFNVTVTNSYSNDFSTTNVDGGDFSFDDSLNDASNRIATRWSWCSQTMVFVSADTNLLMGSADMTANLGTIGASSSLLLDLGTYTVPSIGTVEVKRDFSFLAAEATLIKTFLACAVWIYYFYALVGLAEYWTEVSD